MKIKLFVLSFFVIALPTMAQNSKAIKYSDRILKELQNTTPLSVLLFKNEYRQNTLSAANIQREKEKIERSILKSIARLQAMDGFEGDTKLRDAALAWLTQYKYSLDDEYVQAIPFLEQKSVQNTEQAKLLELQNRLFKDEDAVGANFLNAQKYFTFKYNLDSN